MTIPYDLKKPLAALKEAIDNVYRETPSLIQRQGLEQAIVFRIGVNLEPKLSECGLPSQVVMDCEYNKHLGGIKIIPWNNEKGEKSSRPDLIFHQRNTNSSNLMIVEFKGWWNTDLDDLKKLKALTDAGGDYKYKLGIFVKLNETKPEYTFFQNGQEVSE